MKLVVNRAINPSARFRYWVVTCDGVDQNVIVRWEPAHQMKAIASALPNYQVKVRMGEGTLPYYRMYDLIPSENDSL